MEKKIKICFVGNLSSTFIKKDYEILRKHFDVFVMEPPKKISKWIKYLLNVKSIIKNSDFAFCWFAGWHSTIPVYYANKYNKFSAVVVGGYDTAYIPEINYGAFTNLKEKISAKYVLNNAHLVLPFSNSSKNEALKRAKINNIKVIYIGIDVEKFKKSIDKEKDLVITIGEVKWSNLKRKGIETFVKSAKYIPSAKFVVIGKIRDDSINYLKSIAPSNVIFTGFISDEEVLIYCQKAKVYVQVSAHEGFGLALAESMSCEAIPVVTNRAAISEVAGETGYFVPFGNEIETAESIKKALNASDTKGEKARDWIKKNFTIENREKQLIEIIEKYSKK